LQEARQTERVYGLKSYKLKVKENTYPVHNLCEQGMAFYLSSSSAFAVGEILTSVVLEPDDFPVPLDARVVHISDLSSLRSNYPVSDDSYLCGAEFIFKNSESRHALVQFLSSLKVTT
jgi:hypothetical protein